MEQDEIREQDTPETTGSGEKAETEEVIVNEKPVSKFRGLYRYVHISVKALDWIIIACIAVIIIVVAFSLRDPGYVVTYDSNGGSDVEPVKYQYGDFIAFPEPPTREGYTFGGWFIDSACKEAWNLEKNTVGGPVTLYALWIPNK